jgi:hypothetical protein
MMGEVEVANRAAIMVKEKRKQELWDEDQKVVDYNRKKAIREEEHASELNR